MQTISELKSMQEQMASDLARLPQYRALKAMDRFLAELSQIYEGGPSPSAREDDPIREKVNLAIETRLSAETHSLNSPRVTPYIPGHRVA